MKNQLHKTRNYFPKLLVLLSVWIVFGLAKLNAQALSGTYQIPTGTYTTIAAAITALNANGVAVTGTGVTFNIATGYTETAPAGGFRLTATGTATDPIIFQIDPTTLPGANPIVTSQVGVSTTLDGVFFLLGSDYVTIDGIDLQESAGNVTATTQMEWGYALLIVDSVNGSSYNTIKNCSITLNKTNAASKAIYSHHHKVTSVTVLNPISAAGTQSYNKFYSLKIQNTTIGIYINGYDAPAPFTLKDVGIDIGGSSYATADTITNLGAVGPQAIFTNNLQSPNISYNYIDNALNGSGATSGSTYGIIHTFSGSFYQNSSTVSTFNNNYVKLTGSSSATLFNMYISNTDGNLYINNNDIKWSNQALSTGGMYGIYLTHAAFGITGNLELKNNTIRDITVNNSTGTVNCIYMTTPTQTTTDVSGNIINNITRTGGTTGSFYGINYQFTSPNQGTNGTTSNFYNNSVKNLSLNYSGSASVFGIQQAGNYTFNAYNNVVDSINVIGGSALVTIYGMFITGGSDVSVYNNRISNLNGNRDMYGINFQPTVSTPYEKIFNNNIYNITSSGSAAAYNVYGISAFYSGSVYTKIFNNKINNLNQRGTAASMVSGIAIQQGAAGGSTVYVPVYIENNIIGNLNAPFTTTASTIASIMGINLAAFGTTNPYTANIRFNNIYLNDSAQANANSAGIYQASFAGNSLLNINNNIIVNRTQYLTVGTGLACGIMKNNTSLAGYATTSSNNLFNIGTPSSSRLFYYDLTNKDSVFTTFKSRVFPRDNNSFTENVTMFNTLSSPSVTQYSNNYLQNDTTVTSLVEGGALSIAGITTDFRGNTRSVSTPDIGAFESVGTGINQVYDSVLVVKNNANALVNYTNQPVVNIQVYVSGNANALTATQIDLSTNGTVSSADITKAKIFYTGSSSTFSTVNATSFGSVVNNPNGSFTMNGSQALVYGMNNFWLTYDISPTATVGNIVDGELTSVIVSSITKSSTNGNPTGTKTIAAPLNGSAYTVGTSPYLTFASVINALNANGVSGATTINVPATFTETAPVGGYKLGSEILNNSLSAINTLSFVKQGAGANPLLTGNVGTSTTIDGIFFLLGCDYVTINGIDLLDPATNATITTQNEWGYSLLKFSNAAPFNGCQYNTIKNCTITMQRICALSKGIYLNNHTATDATILISTTVDDANSYNTIIANTIQNVNSAIYLNGYSKTGGTNTDQRLFDLGNVIGSVGNGNNIYNFGGLTAAGFGCFIANQGNVNVKYNNIDNYNGGANGAIGASAFQITGIHVNNTLTSFPNITNPNISNNSVIITMASAATVLGLNINVQNSHGDVVVSNNDLKWNTLTAGHLGTLSGLLVNTTGNSFVANSLTCSGNTMKNFTYKCGGAGAVIFFQVNCPAMIEEISYDSIYNITRTASSTVSTGTTTIFQCVPTSNPGMTTMETQVRNAHDNFISNVNNGGTTVNTGGLNIMVINSHFNINVYNNRVSSIFTGGSATTNIYGLLMSGTALNVNIYNNIFDTIGCTSGLVYGLSYNISGAKSTNIRDNQFSNFSIATGIATQIMAGIFVTSGGRNMNIYRNKVYNLTNSSTGTGAYCTGIFYNGIGNGSYSLTPTSIHHNLISNIFASGALNTTLPAVSGFLIGAASPTGFPTLTLAHNTVLLSGSTGSNINSAGIYTAAVNAFSSNFTPSLKFNNNIIINNITRVGTGIASAFHNISATNYNTLDNSSNNNVYYAGTPSTTNLIYFDGATGKDQTVLAYQARMYPRENASGTENVTFTSTNGTSASYLKPDVTVNSVIADAGTPVTDLTTDYLGSSISATTPDVGAYEDAFLQNDIIAPAITMTVLNNIGVNTTSINFNATIKDLTGTADVSSGTPPTVYYKKNTSGTYTASSNGTFVSGNATTGIWNFTIDAASLGGISINDSISYYVIAQDIVGSPNVGSAPAGVVASNVYSITTNPTPYKFYVKGELSGNYTVCASGCDFATLTNTYGAFDSINKSALSNNVTLTIAGDLTTETGTIMLNQLAQNANYGISIVPDGNTERLIVGSVAAPNYGLLTLNGADRVTIDGRFAGAGKYLRFRNRNTGGVTIRLTNDSHLDTIRYAYIEGLTTLAGTVWLNAPSANGTGNDSNAVMYCDISDTLGNGINTSTSLMVVQNTGFYSDRLNNSSNTIAYNNIYNFIYQGVNIASGLAGNDFWTIDHNSFYQGPAAAAKAGQVGSTSTQAIQVSSGQGHTITNNSIGGSAPDRSGDAWKGGYLSTGGKSFTGIDLPSSNLGLEYLTTISGNTISNIDANPITTTFPNPGSYQFAGIVVASGLVNITNNTIGGGAMPYDTIKEGSYSTTNVGGIVLAGGKLTVSGNTVSHISSYFNAQGLTGVRTAGINIAASGAAPNNYNVINNTIHDIKSNYNYSTTSNLYSFQGTSPCGILNATGTAPIANIEGNTIYNIINTQIGVMGTANMAYGITIRGGINTVHKNKIYNISGLGNGTGDASNFVYGIFVSAATTAPQGQIIKNNQISLTTTSANESQLFGIMDACTGSFTNSIFNNSVYVGGTATGSNKTYALAVANNASFTISNAYNNILFNERTGGSGTHYALGSYFSSNGFNANTLNYNLLVAPNANSIAELLVGNNVSVAGINAMFTTKANTNWMTNSSTLSSSNLFTSPSAGNLSIINTNTESWYVNGKGLALSNVTTDYNGASRSVTIGGGSTDIGAFEFNTSTTPPSATESAAPANSTTTTYTFAGRQVASVDWGATGTVPTTLAVKHYTGTVAPSLNPVMKAYKGYYSLTPTGGSGYNYNVTLSYDSAMFGNLPSFDNAKLARYNSSAWTQLTASTPNKITGQLSGNTLMASSTLPANFTIADTTTIPVSNAILNLTAYLQGYYLGGGLMNASIYNSDGITLPNVADSITVELHETVSPFGMLYSVKDTLSTTGHAMISFPGAASGSSYYILLKHRNSISTWSANPVSIGSTTSYDFSTAANKSFGDNMIDDGTGVFLIYGGDVDGSGTVDSGDYPDVDSDSFLGNGGYILTDVDGSGTIDSGDYPVLDLNSFLGVSESMPF